MENKMIRTFDDKEKVSDTVCRIPVTAHYTMENNTITAREFRYGDIETKKLAAHFASLFRGETGEEL